MKRPVLLISIFLTLFILISACSEKHDVQGQSVEYKDGDTLLKGYLARDKLAKDKQPGIIIVHEWWGQNKYVRARADMLAALGYTALAVDMFGNAAQADNSEDAAKLATEISENPDIRRARFMAALNFLKEQEGVDPDRIAAIGYSFGGNIVLKMALEGTDLAGVVSFYGGLLVDKPAEPDSVKARILILHGEKDWYITPQMISKFKVDMKAAGIDYKIVNYKDANHGFTNADAEIMTSKFKGLRYEYNEEADKKSWADMQEFFKMIFHKI